MAKRAQGSSGPDRGKGGSQEEPPRTRAEVRSTDPASIVEPATPDGFHLPKIETSEPTPTMIARQSLAEAEGDALTATDIMVERVMNDTRLYKILMDPLVKTACYDAINAQYIRQRRRIWYYIKPSADAFANQVKALAQVVASDFGLRGGKK